MQQQTPQITPEGNLPPRVVAHRGFPAQAARALRYGRFPGASKDVFWNVVLELVDAHLRRRPIDKSGQITLAGRALQHGQPHDHQDDRTKPDPSGAARGGFEDAFPRTDGLLLDSFMLCKPCEGPSPPRTFGLRKRVPKQDEYYFGRQLLSPHRSSRAYGCDDIEGKVPGDIRFLLMTTTTSRPCATCGRTSAIDLSRKSSFDLQRLPQLYASSQQSFQKSVADMTSSQSTCPGSGSLPKRATSPR